MSRDVTCLICGHTPWDAASVRVALIRWRDGRERFGAGPRCQDVDACRDRVAAAGDSWPVDERTATELEAEAIVERIHQRRVVAS